MGVMWSQKSNVATNLACFQALILSSYPTDQMFKIVEELS